MHYFGAAQFTARRTPVVSANSHSTPTPYRENPVETEMHLLTKMRLVSSLLIAFCVLFGAMAANAQQGSSPDGAPSPLPADPASIERKPAEHQHSQNHIFWVIPNFREDENPDNIKPLTPRLKIQIAFEDSFDPSAFLVAGVFAGSAMAQRQYAFGQGMEGFAKYYGGAFADQAIGNMMTEGLFPIALGQDPRYFPKIRGSFLSRTGYAMSREVITRGDDGKNQFNTSELLGNAVAAGISNAYYPAVNRSLSNTANKWVQQIALDSAFNVMKEFWPDVRRKVFGPGRVTANLESDRAPTQKP